MNVIRVVAKTNMATDVNNEICGNQTLWRSSRFC